MTDPQRKIMADTMTSGELAAHRARNGIVLLPIGCFEMHGVHVGMSCDTFIAEAACRILAEGLGAVVFPPIHYTFPGATGPWPGTVSLTPEEAAAYIKAVTKAILRNGFKRVALVNVHGPGAWYIQFVLRQIFEETGELPILLRPGWGDFHKWVREEFEYSHGEAAAYLAALHIFGRHGEFDPATTEDQMLRGGPPFGSYSDLAQHGVLMPYRYVRPEQHVSRYPGLTLEDAERCAKVLRESILKAAEGLPEDYERFQADMKAALAEAPWDDYPW